MTKELQELQPSRLWHYFLEICKIPRPSKKEEKIAAYLVDFAKTHHLDYRVDKTGNVIINKPAMAGYEKLQGVILQSHLDMVCEKNSDTAHDFDKDPIVPWIDETWVKAQGTTLGADDGIGIAATLAILESKDIPHGPLEALFTMDEETGLTGAFALVPGQLKSKILINLDSEDEGQLFIGCAGGKDTVATLIMETEPTPDNHLAFKANLTGLKGGHSGDDINKGLGNAVKLMNRFLWNAHETLEIALADFNAGNLRNAIAREAFAVFTIPEENLENLKKYATQFAEEIRNELQITEPGIAFTIEPAPMPELVLDHVLQTNLLDALYACPHGVIAMSREIPNFVETSTNLASVKMNDGKIIITTSQRSSVESSKKDVADMVASVFYLIDAEVEHSSGYPGWKPNPDSQILRLTADAYRKLFNEEPQILAIHAGLECGLVGAIYPGMDMVSFGPTIKGAHSPAERLDIPSTVKFWELTLAVLKNIPVR
ncbi:MAG: aminoacyl-histidine dipeptidase [Bacteroidales bacterium]|nr:aminoacyl-histidine dipeptidase [Bacteroidales bacterium]MDD4604461.1 aminoacyl-histidine dipeptidase [Bacteroidales bacterium]